MLRYFSLFSCKGTRDCLFNLFFVLLLIYRNAMDFCKLILCPENSTNLLINASSFLVASPPGKPHVWKWKCSLLSCVWLFVTPRTAACQASLSFTISWNLFKLKFVHWVGDTIQQSHPLSHLFPPVEVVSLYAYFLESFYHECILNFIIAFSVSI